MSNGLPQRLLKFAIGIDEALNGLLGGARRETISGSIGRALEAGKAWAPTAEWMVDGLFGPGHCREQAANEAARRAALAAVVTPQS